MKKTYPIDEHLKLALNGTTLDFRIRGTSEHNPVLLFLHGGPGSCDRLTVLEDRAPLTDICTLVCFDQRGSGKSYSREQAAKHMDMETAIEDVIAVVEYLLTRFHQEKLYLVGHSYGSFLAVNVCQRIPEKIAAYIGLGQLANGPENERISYEFVWEEAQKRGEKKAIQALTRIGAPVNGMYRSIQDLSVQRNLMNRYGGAIYDKKGNIFTSMVLPALRTPEYSLVDLIGYIKGVYYNLGELWEEVVACDFVRTVPKLDVPVFITQGRYDRNTPPEIAKAWFDVLQAPQKEWIWFEKSAHSPCHEEKDKWNEVVRNRVFGKE